MPYCIICGRHIPESEGMDVCKVCEESQDRSTYPLILFPAKSRKAVYALIALLSFLLGLGIFLFLLFRHIFI